MPGHGARSSGIRSAIVQGAQEMTTVTTLAGAVEVTLAELRREAFPPADPVTVETALGGPVRTTSPATAHTTSSRA
ncbi:hypothetical protein [Streptomyces sp. NPDC001492]